MIIRGFFGYQNLMRPRYQLKPGEQASQLRDGRILVVHPDRSPKVVNPDGSETVITAHDYPEPTIEKRN